MAKLAGSLPSETLLMILEMSCCFSLPQTVLIRCAEIFNNTSSLSFHDRDTRASSSEIDTNDITSRGLRARGTSNAKEAPGGGRCVMVAMEASGRDSVQQRCRRRGGRRRRNALQEPRRDEGAKRGHGDDRACETRQGDRHRVGFCMLF